MYVTHANAAATLAQRTDWHVTGSTRFRPWVSVSLKWDANCHFLKSKKLSFLFIYQWNKQLTASGEEKEKLQENGVRLGALLAATRSILNDTLSVYRDFYCCRIHYIIIMHTVVDQCCTFTLTKFWHTKEPQTFRPIWLQAWIYVFFFSVIRVNWLFKNSFRCGVICAISIRDACHKGLPTQNQTQSDSTYCSVSATRSRPNVFPAFEFRSIFLYLAGRQRRAAKTFSGAA